MKTAWLKGLDDEGKEEVKASFLSSGLLREILSQILIEKRDAATTSQLLKDSYESPNWAYKQADLCGYNRAMQEILSLLENK